MPDNYKSTRFQLCVFSIVLLTIMFIFSKKVDAVNYIQGIVSLAGLWIAGDTTGKIFSKNE